MVFIQLNKFEHAILTLMYEKYKMRYLTWDDDGIALVFKNKPVWDKKLKGYVDAENKDDLDQFEILNEFTAIYFAEKNNLNTEIMPFLLLWLDKKTGIIPLKPLLDATTNDEAGILENILNAKA